MLDKNQDKNKVKLQHKDNEKLIKGHRKGRLFALQAIYQWELNSDTYSELEVQFKVANSYHKYVNWDLFAKLVQGVIKEHAKLDLLFKDYLPDGIDSVNRVELAILRLGSFELKFCPDTPFKVVISEYISLAVEFGASQGEKFINGVLDKVAKAVRVAK